MSQMTLPFGTLWDWSPVLQDCPVCKAAAGEPCKAGKLYTPTTFHESRITLARHNGIGARYNPRHHVPCVNCHAHAYVPCEDRQNGHAYTYQYQCTARLNDWFEWIRAALKLECPACSATAGRRCGDTAEDGEVHLVRMEAAGLFSVRAQLDKEDARKA